VPTAAALIVTTLLLAGCGSGKPPDDSGDYVTRITRMRQAKDEAFRKPCCSDSSPVPDAKKSEFLPLSYYPIDESYKVPAVLTPSDDKTIFQMPTSSGQPRAERRAGTLTFTLHGQEMKLTAFVEADAPNMDRLFVPFGDTTNGKETYAGGRFLDLDRTLTGVYEIDFNQAYTPYCYYNPTFECPYPPPENRLKVPIEAGEKTKAKS
jgi:uncharacterized protein (DUF1684 family)